MADDAKKIRRVDLGFRGNQVLALRLGEDSLSSLHEALEGGSGGWHRIATEDSEITVDLGQIAYVRLETETHRVGF